MEAATAERAGVRAVSLPAVRGLGMDTLLLGALFLLMACFGRSFSRLELGPSWLHPTEVVVLAVAVVAVASTGIRGAYERIRETRVLIPLLVLWLVGAIAAIRGLRDFGFSAVLHDIGLVEYSVLVPVMALTVRDRRSFEFICASIVLGGGLAIGVYAASLWGPEEILDTIEPIAVASAMYVTLFAIWPAARGASGGPMRWPEAALAVFAVLLVVLSAARAGWLALLAAGVLLVGLSVPGRRIVTAGAVSTVLLAGLALSVPLDDFKGLRTPTDEAVAEDAGGEDGALAVEEVRRSFESSEDTGQSQNATWRLAYWEYLLEESRDSPLAGVGFGAPSNFVWDGKTYDARTGDPSNSFDVTGPHNSFVNVLYRTGVFGILALVAIVVIAIRRIWPLTRDDDERVRALSIWLLAGLLATAVVASLTVALEGPFMGIYFWGLLGLAVVAPRVLRAERKGQPASAVPGGAGTG